MSFTYSQQEFDLLGVQKEEEERARQEEQRRQQALQLTPTPTAISPELKE